MTNDFVVERYSYINECFERLDYLFESVDILDESVGETLKNLVKTIIRKIRAIIGQMAAIIKTIKGECRIPTTGEWIDIPKANQLMDKLLSGQNVSGESVPMLKSRGDTKIKPTALQSIINKANKMIQIIERKGDNQTNEDIENLKFTRNVLRESVKLMKGLSTIGEDDVKENMERFKKAYHYDPNKRTIRYDGHEIAVRFFNDHDTTPDERKDSPYSVHTGKTPRIYLNERFFKLSNDKQQEAILAHEVGHMALHGKGTKNPVFNKNLAVATKHVDNLPSVKSIAFMQAVRPDLVTDEMREKAEASAKEYDETLELIKKNASNPDVQKRYKNIEKYAKLASKYSDYNRHIKADEFEADAYAAARTSKEDVVGALDRYARLTLKEMSPKARLERKDSLKYDNKARSKALNKRGISREIYGRNTNS